MMHKLMRLTILLGFLVVNTYFIVISDRGFSAFASATKPVHLLISANTQWRYFETKSLENYDWIKPAFDDSNWRIGASGFGYGDGDDRTILDSMRGEYDKLIIRKKFEVSDLNSIKQLYLYMRFDDAFIAYLNGHEIARSGVLGKAGTYKVDSHEASDYELFAINEPLNYLRQGENLLAVAGFNRSVESSDFSIEPVLASVKVKNPGLPLKLSKDEWYFDLDYLQSRLEDQSSYLLLGKFDYKSVFQKIKNNFGERSSGSGLEFARELQKLIVQIGDAHAGVNVNMDDVDDNYLPFILADTSIGVVALNSDQTGFLQQDYPILMSIDGLSVQKWLDIAANYVPQASPQLIRYQSFRQLRSIDRMRTEHGLPKSTVINVRLQSLDGLRNKSFSYKTSNKRLPSAKVNFRESAILGGNIGYLRVSSMYDSVDKVVPLMNMFKATRALIIDVRNNRGGRYEILRALYGYFIEDKTMPYVSNIAAYRLSSSFDQDHLHYRPTFRLNHDSWSDSEIFAIKNIISKFKPQWEIPSNKFSNWHYMVLGKSSNQKQYHYKQPVIVLSNPASFSATDGFLSAFADLPQVTLMGQASSGGSGATQHFRLPNSGIEVALSSMASFRPNGKLYDTNGIEVDVSLMPEPSDFTGVSDSVLDQALNRLNHNK